MEQTKKEKKFNLILDVCNYYTMHGDGINEKKTKWTILLPFDLTQYILSHDIGKCIHQIYIIKFFVKK